MNRRSWGRVWALVLLACAATLCAEERTTVEVESGAVVVKSAAGETTARAGETVVVDARKMVKRKGPDGVARSYATVAIDGKTISVTGEGGNNEADVRNGRITIRSGGLIITGDSANLKVGDTPYDISKAKVVAISVQGGRVKVDTSEQALTTVVQMEPAGILTIHIDRQGQYRLGSDSVGLERVREKLAKTAREHPARIVLVQPNRGANHDDIERVLELCRREGLKNVSVLAKKATPRQD